MFWTTASLITLLSCVYAAPTAVSNTTTLPFPQSGLPNGIVPSGVPAIAGGNLPNSSTPIKVDANGGAGLQLLQFLENLEAYFYYEGVQNLTNVWDISHLPNNTIEVVSTIDAQEQLHVAALGAALAQNKLPTVPPCNFTFPGVDSPEAFFYVANLITSANFGGIIGTIEQLGLTNPTVPGPAAGILGVETRHDAYLRELGGYIPNPTPFETGIPNSWAYHIGLAYVVPGSCPVEIPLPLYPDLNLDPPHPLKPVNASYPTSVAFTWDTQQAWVDREGNKQLYVAWLNQAGQPRYTNLTITKPGAGTAKVPEGLAGVAYAALTTQQPSDFDGLVGATLAGPVPVVIS